MRKQKAKQEFYYTVSGERLRPKYNKQGAIVYENSDLTPMSNGEKGKCMDIICRLLVVYTKATN